MPRKHRCPLAGPKFAPVELVPYGSHLGAVETCSPAIAPGRQIRVCVTRPGRPGPAMRSGEDVCAMFAATKDHDREGLYALHLDTKNRVIGVEEIGRGSLTAVETTQREVFKGAMLTNANSIILAHNHPSGDATPSEDDRQLTVALIAAGKLLGIPVRDHIVIGTDGCVSLRSIMPRAGFSGTHRRR